MATVLLAVSPDYSASGVVAQGSIDAGFQYALGAPLPCPGVFPCSIKAKARVAGGSTGVVESVFAGPNHVAIREQLHNYVASVGTTVRLETVNRAVKLAGGPYTEPLGTPQPLLTSYAGQQSISLNGLPLEFIAGTYTGSATIGDNSNPAAAGNSYSSSDLFTYAFSDKSYLGEGINLLFSGNLGAGRPVSINLDGDAGYLTTPGSLLPSKQIKQAKYPVLTNGTDITDGDTVWGSGSNTPGSLRPAVTYLASENAPIFGCFNSGTGLQNSSVFGLQPGGYIDALAVYGTDTSNGAYVFAGIRKNDSTPYIGKFFYSDVDVTQQQSPQFFQFYKSYVPASGLKPAFGFDTNLRSVNNYGTGTQINSFWSAAYPQGRRYNKYSDVKATQYGFVFLNKITQHLEFMFQPHVEPWFVSPKVQTINKLVHAPPRSADYYPALNMLLGVDPRNPINGASLYQQNDATIKGYFANDQITHGGGGHVMALGTFNGAIVNNGQVTVWGSNRWGQCVTPDALTAYVSSGGKIVDVAVANAPPVFKEDGQNYATNAVYSDDLGEYWARYYSAGYDPNTGTRTSFYSYPPRNSERYGQHINFTNLPGHVVVVTDNGYVYAWGNDKYYQCQVPDEISLVDSGGAIKTTAPADPISEVSAGAFHTVARSRSGTVYVWGAGGPWSSGSGSYGRVVGTSANDLIPAYGGNASVYGTVHFGQSFLGGSFGVTTHLGVQAPQANPLTQLTANNVENYSLVVSTTTITDLVKSVNGSNVTVGQKTVAGFSVADPGSPAGSSGRLKGMIAAGAFHTAIIDSALKIQCIGAGKGQMDAATTDVSTVSQETASNGAAIWGSAYSYQDTFYSTYPHYCQSMDQYRAPLAITGTTPLGVGLFRRSSDTTLAHKSRYFQNLQFKKVTCGPFTTHGIIYSIDRANTTTNPYTALDKTYLHNRVVSWGCAMGLRLERGNAQATGPTGLRSVFGSTVTQVGMLAPTDISRNNQPGFNPSGSIAGTGAINVPNQTPRYFEIINRAIGSTGGIYASQTNLVSAPGPDSSAPAVPGGSVGVCRSTETTTTGPCYNSHCPVTISRFKVKDVASCGDYTIFIGFINTLSQSSAKWYAGDTGTYGGAGTSLSAATFDYQASVFFTGADYYNTASYPSIASLPGRLHATNPYAGNNLVRRNKIGAPYVHYGQTGKTLKDTSLHFGIVKQAASISYRLPGDASDSTTVNYVIPTTALASSNLATAVVNMDNRPVAWSGFFQMDSYYEAPIDLTLLPSVPIQSFKTGKSHIMAVTAGDWPVAISLGSANNTPKLVTELGSRLFSTTIPSVSIAPGLIYGEPDVYKRQALIAWGAGDGREYGGTLLSFSAGGSGIGSTFGVQFLDTHAVTRYDAVAGGITGATQPLSAGSDSWENYYGEYRWNINSKYDGYYGEPYIEVSSTGGSLGSQYGGPQQPTDGAISLPAGHHAVDAMQSLLSFRQDKYPANFTNPALTGRNLLNGTSVAAIPAAYGMPFVTYTSYPTGTDLKKVVCCATAADEASANYASLNSLLEFHSPLGYMQQTYTDYVVDYAAGSKHSAVLFSSSCSDYTKIADGTYKTSLANFNTYFMSDATGQIPFGNRRVCKLGIVGYGCENQTAGAERALPDGIAPIVPMLFARDARVYCGDSYTLVTNPVKIHTLTSSATALNLTAGASTSSLTIPITVPSSLFSKRIRGLDVVLTFTATSAPANLPLTNLTITIPYKNNTWIVLDQIRANLDTTPATAYIQGGTNNTTFRVSSRFWNGYYNYSNPVSGEAYTELGTYPTVSTSYTNVSSNYCLKGFDSSAAIPALSKQGCYFAAGVGPTGISTTPATWSFISGAGVVLPFNESTINVVITDASNSTSYAGYTLTVKLEVEVDAGEVPYVIFGPNRSGVYNELEGQGPSYVADIGALGYDNNRPNVDILSCPCEIDLTLQDRRYPKSFPADSRFICGTKKYGPSGNRELQAAYATETYYYQDGSTRPPLLGGSQITANFFSIFDTIPHRASPTLLEQLKSENSVLQVLPSGAFVNVGAQIPLPLNSFGGLLQITTANNRNVLRGLVGTVNGVLSNSGTLYNKAFFGTATPTASVASSALNLFVGLTSNCT